MSADMRQRDSFLFKIYHSTPIIARDFLSLPLDVQKNFDVMVVVEGPPMSVRERIRNLYK